MAEMLLLPGQVCVTAAAMSRLAKISGYFEATLAFRDRNSGNNSLLQVQTGRFFAAPGMRNLACNCQG
jgi:hypothetical protein